MLYGISIPKGMPCLLLFQIAESKNSQIKSQLSDMLCMFGIIGIFVEKVDDVVSLN